MSYNNDITSPSEMVMDTDDYVGIPNESEKEPVAIINPDNDNDIDNLQDLPLATDRKPCWSSLVALCIC
ncbi:hypothetical protein HYQ44_005338 [Verticillium longisporum]|nr:hypothetical protein HYQ44_005338 [Verticillium longisporum]